MCEPVVLIIDNKPNVLASNRDYLEAQGYMVLTAENEEQAERYCEEEVIHVAVIDIRLRDDSDESDDSGLRLAKRLDHSIIKIILTGQPFPNPEAAEKAICEMLEPNERGDSLAVRFVRKGDGPEKVLDAIQQAFQTRLGFGSHPEITREKGFSWSTLVDQLKMFRNREGEAKQKAERVLRDLTCRLFSKASKVNFLRAIPGHGHCTVALAQQDRNNVPGTSFAVKFGPRESISLEQLNYQEFVEPHVERRARLELGPVWSREMGAIAYSFVGKEAPSVRAFLDYYNDEIVSVEQIKKVVSYLFQVSCKNWYGGKRRLAKNEREPLDRLYRGYLNLLDEPHVAELKNQFGQLAQQQTLGNSSMFLLKDGHLQVQIADRQQIILPNPVLFALEEHSSKARRDFFPPPAQVAITHGDLHSGNIVVGDAERIWLIDFYKTGWGHILRDFAELESDIKFTLLQSNSLRERYDLEEALLTPKSLREPIVGLLKHPTPVQTRALETIQHLRSLACQLTDVEKVHEYHIALLFLALKRMIGFTSADSAKPSESIAQYHALLSAAMICERLQTAARKANSPSEAKKKIFLSYASEDRDKVDRLYQQLSDAGHEPWIDHKELVGGEDWNGSIKLAIENSAIFISCLSKNSVGKRGFFQREANQAVDKVQEMLPRDIFIIPVMLEECDLPERLAKYHAIQLYQEDGWPQLLKAIAESKRRRQQQ